MGLFSFLPDMNKVLIFLFALILLGCKNDEYSPDKYLTADERQKLLQQVVRYSEKRAPHATALNRFDTIFNWYYDKAVKEYDVRRYYIDKTGEHYFLFTRAARSITPMREAIGGKLRVENDSLTEYEELFRTWKMNEDSLNTRAFELFDKMINGEDLTKYGPKYQGDRYVEFPDDRFYFDKERRMWRDRVMEAR
jgi:hypothetical protein